MSGHIGKVVTLYGRHVQVTADGNIENTCARCVFHKNICPDPCEEAAAGIPACYDGPGHHYTEAPGLMPRVPVEASPVQSNTTSAHDRLGGVVSKL